MTRRVAFLAHFRDGRDLQLFDPSFSVFEAAACEEFLEKTSSVFAPFILETRELSSAAGERVHLSIIAVPFTAAQASAALRSGRSERILAQIDSAISLAQASGASLVGFGGYTSILTDNCRTLARHGLGFTSGNSLTVASAVRALDASARDMALNRRILGVVGATGNIGATLAEVGADSADEIVLIGRRGAVPRLSRLAARLGKPATITTDLGALRDCTMIVSASNSAKPVIYAEHVNDSEPVVLCDVSVPNDVSPCVARERPNARIIRGGTLCLPAQQDLGVPVFDLPSGRVYACLGETLVLGLSAIDRSFSFGPLRADRVRFIGALAAHHGFTTEFA
jgi:predicted amino acid dehydrogenase